MNYNLKTYYVHTHTSTHTKQSGKQCYRPLSLVCVFLNTIHMYTIGALRLKLLQFFTKKLDTVEHHEVQFRKK